MGPQDKIKQALDKAPIDWLLDTRYPTIVARTLIDVLGKASNDSEVIAAQQAVSTSPDVVRILEGQEADGHWGQPTHYFEKMKGTAWRWLLLHKLGLDPMHPQMLATARFILDIASVESGGFASHVNADPVPCYNGRLLWAFMRSGLGEDPRVQAGVQWVLDNMWYADGDETVACPDDGCWGRHTCYRGVVPIVKALVDLPEQYRNENTDLALQEGLEFILTHHVYKRSHQLDKVMNAKLTQLTFPPFYWPDFVEVLLILTRAGIQDPRMEDSITYLLKKQAMDGTWKLQRTYNERSKHDTFPVVVPLEKRGAPSQWVTLRALTVLKSVLDGAL